MRNRSCTKASSGGVALACGAFLARSKHHHHLTAFEFGHSLDLSQLGQIVAHALKNAHAQLLVSHLTAAEPQRDFSLVALFQEAAQIAQLDLVVTFVGRGTEFDFLDLDDLLFGAGFGLPLLFLVLELAVVHQTADWRIRVGRDLDQIHVSLFGKTERIGELYDAQLFSVQTYQAHLGDTDLTVDAIGFFSGDVDNS